ncbi:YkgJ family cysteine cluster protein [Pannus brasiliensis CCIBt3594]|uniref:YkgJ family cysteine cluster protein n=1 Tax=Pannus brasiliensis CCIBt3594 TaxID=1427578 RepID=A0AAW9QTR0_9CHRO
MPNWRCITGCGACCQLNPDERDLEDYLTEAELQQYLSMVGEGGWCIHFDHQTRLCTIYENRPIFCRVKPDIFERMYQIEPTEFDEFAIDCCHQHIEDLYGEDSEEMNRYLQEVG